LIVVEAIGRQLPVDLDPDALAFTGPGGGPGVKRGERSALSIANLRRAYKAAVVERIGGTWDRPITKPRFPDLDLHGPHDLRHTFATWLEDAGILARAIDEVMGHRDHRAARAGGSVIGSRYRHTTPDTEARIRAAINDRLTTAVDTAVRLLAAQVQLTPAPAGMLTAPRRPRHAKRATS